MPSQVTVVIAVSTAISIEGMSRTGILSAGLVDMTTSRGYQFTQLYQCMRTTHLKNLFDHNEDNSNLSALTSKKDSDAGLLSLLRIEAPAHSPPKTAD